MITYHLDKFLVCADVTEVHVGMPIQVKLFKDKNWKEKKRISFSSPDMDPSWHWIARTLMEYNQQKKVTVCLSLSLFGQLAESELLRSHSMSRESFNWQPQSDGEVAQALARPKQPRKIPMRLSSRAVIGRAKKATKTALRSRLKEEFQTLMRLRLMWLILPWIRTLRDVKIL